MKEQKNQPDIPSGLQELLGPEKDSDPPFGQAQEQDLPIPMSQWIELKIASRTQFWRWEALGLKIIRVGGKNYLRASELNRFMDEQNAKIVDAKEAA